MSYVLRDRADGQVEIVASHPVLVGTFPDRAMAERVCAFLMTLGPDPIGEQPVARTKAQSHDPEAGLQVLRAAAERGEKLPPPPPPTLILKPQQAAQAAPSPHSLTLEQIDLAFSRIQQGEKITVVAEEFGLPMGQLRGMWANHRRQEQKHIAEGGQQPCAHCQRLFMPSVSHPDTCARCSHG